MELQIPTVTVDDLRHFHAKHFPDAPLPEHYLHGVQHEVEQEYDDGMGYYNEDGEDDLGYYEDGVKRTLTDEQIAMFRHSEIQRILLKRTRRKEAGEPIHRTPSPEVGMEDSPAPLEAASVREASPASDESMSISSDDEQPKAAPVEKQGYKWTAVSEKTRRARAAKNRKKNRKNHRAKKREELKKQKKEAKEVRRRGEEQQQQDEDGESDEWDPWHQANGPDAQNEDAVDLDY